MNTENINMLNLLAATAQGDVWLNADAAAIALGMISPNGEPNRRAFLDRVACLPNFPAALKIGTQKKWRKSALMQWAEDEARANA